MQLVNGTLLQGGKYRIEKVLGQGGFGITYLAENTMLDGKVAIKEFFFKEYCDRESTTSHVTVGTSGNREIVERFKMKFIKEARTIFKLSHPNIIRILDVFEENATAYYVMEYIEGESLSYMVQRRGAIPELEALGYIKDVAEALEYIHRHKMNHLDVKPGNIMRRHSDARILLIDFGVAKQYDLKTSEGTTTTPVGISHGYSPAEQYLKNGVQTFSPQSDVYSLAATLYKLLTGLTPPEAMELQEDGLPLEPLRHRGVSEQTIAAIVAAMKNRKQRTQSISLFVQNIMVEPEVTIVKPKPKPQPSPSPTPSSTPTPSPSPSPTSSSYSKLLVGIIVAILVIGGGIFWVSSRPDKPNPEVEAVFETKVEKKTIVLDHGAESKRHFVYTGEVDEKGIPNGEGTALYPETKSASSCTYKGKFVNGLPSKGEMVFSSGVKYKGTFDSGCNYKDGTYTMKDGYYFVGKFSKGQPYNGKWYTAKGVEDAQMINGDYK